MDCAGGVLRVVAILAMVATLGCGSKDPVDVLMADLEKAAEARDVDAIERRLASEFTGNEGLSRDETLTTLKRYFVAYQQIHLDVTHVERSKSGDRVSFRVDSPGSRILPSASRTCCPPRLLIPSSCASRKKWAC